MSKFKKTNILLLLLVLAIVILPLIVNPNAPYEGSDDQGEDLIGEMNPDYEPWFDPIWEPPSGEVESLFFSVQVAIGAGIIGYILGMFNEKKKKNIDEKC